ncbi:phosphatidylglycerol lysyltransferase domain-containing protein, partial [Casaltella massiliensis]|nr:phosphatidylglycerol lysyltransferase domain-containing protein [Casaltella massiliensis]
KRIFKNYEKLKDTLKISGIYIDSKLEAFSIGEMLNDNMAVIHVEKANADIRGLYPYINQQFLLNEFSDVEFVNREEDLGIEG